MALYDINGNIVSSQNSNVEESIIEKRRKIWSLKASDFFFGTISGEGVATKYDTTSNVSIVSNQFFVESGTFVVLKNYSSAYRMKWFEYEENGTYITNGGAYQQVFFVEKDKYIRLLFNKGTEKFTEITDGIISDIQFIGKEVILPKSNNFNFIAHRGFWCVAPQNTMSAFKLADRMGFNSVETDIRFTSDNVPVLVHDATITGLDSSGTSQTLTVASSTLEQLKALNLGSNYFDGETVPTLEEFLQWCKLADVKPILEIKEIYDTTSYQALVDMVNKYGMMKNTRFISNGNQVYNLVSLDSRVCIGTWFGGVVPTQSLIEELLTHKTEENTVSVDLQYTKLTDEVQALCKTNKVPLYLWTIDDLETFKTYSNTCAEGITGYLVSGGLLPLLQG